MWFIWGLQQSTGFWDYRLGRWAETYLVRLRYWLQGFWRISSRDWISRVMKTGWKRGWGDSGVIGLTLLKLSGYLLLLKWDLSGRGWFKFNGHVRDRNPDSTPFIVPIGHSNEWTISSLLSGDHYRVLNLLSSILIGVADHFTDSKTVCLPFLMMEQHDLFSFSPDWLNNWDGNGTLVSHSRLRTDRCCPPLRGPPLM